MCFYLCDEVHVKLVFFIVRGLSHVCVCVRVRACVRGCVCLIICIDRSVYLYLFLRNSLYESCM